jgi:hypothetical protein
MNEQENEESQLAKPTARSRISSEPPEQLTTAYAAGIGLREMLGENEHSRGNRFGPR